MDERDWMKEGGIKMKTKMIATLAFALLLGGILITPAAQPNKHLKCEFEMDVFWTTPPHREGTVTGDIEGTLTVTELPATLPGKTEHFLEYSRL
jgi:hypothetical protein